MTRMIGWRTPPLCDCTTPVWEIMDPPLDSKCYSVLILTLWLQCPHSLDENNTANCKFYCEILTIEDLGNGAFASIDPIKNSATWHFCCLVLLVQEIAHFVLISWKLSSLDVLWDFKLLNNTSLLCPHSWVRNQFNVVTIWLLTIQYS